MKKLNYLLGFLILLACGAFVSCSSDDDYYYGDKEMEELLVGIWKPVSYGFEEQTFSEREKIHRLEFKPIDSNNMGACHYYQNNSFVDGRYSKDNNNRPMIEEDYQSRWGITTYEDGTSLFFLEFQFYILAPNSYYVDKLTEQEFIIRNTKTNLVHKFERVK